jgi:hypothetical protein
VILFVLWSNVSHILHICSHHYKVYKFMSSWGWKGVHCFKERSCFFSHSAVWML